MKILLIEDNPGDGKLFEIAAGGGYEIERARTLLDALQRLRAGDPPPLIVADLHLPDALPEAVLAALEPWRSRVVLLATFSPENPQPAGWRAVSKGPRDWLSYKIAVKRVLAG